MPGNVERGMVFGTKIGPENRRFVVIQNDIGNRYSHLYIVAALKSERSIQTPPRFWVHVPRGQSGWDGEGGLKNEDSYVQCNRIGTVDERRLAEFVGKLSTPIMQEVNMVLRISLALD